MPSYHTRFAAVIAMTAIAALAGPGAAAAARAPAGSRHPVIAYVVDGGNDTVTPLNTSTNTFGRSLKVGLGPDAIAFSPDGRAAYVADGNPSTRRPGTTVAVIDTITNRIGRFITVPRGPYELAMTPDGTTLYVATTAGITPINTATKKTGHLIRTRVAGTSGMVVSKGGTTLYVANARTSTVVPISTRTNRPGKPINVGRYPGFLALTPDGRTLCVLSYGSGSKSALVTMIRTATNKAGRPIRIGRVAPSDLAVSPNGRAVYVTTTEPGVIVTPISTATGRLGKPLTISKPARGGGPAHMVISPDGRTLYVASWVAGTVTPVRTATMTREKPIKVPGGAPMLMASTPDGSTIYVTAGSLVAIRTATNKVAKVLTGPNGLVAMRPPVS